MRNLRTWAHRYAETRQNAQASAQAYRNIHAFTLIANDKLVLSS